MTYTAPVNDMMLALKTAGNLEANIARGIYPGLDIDTVRAVIEEAGKFGSEVLAPLNAPGDKADPPPPWANKIAGVLVRPGEAVNQMPPSVDVMDVDFENWIVKNYPKYTPSLPPYPAIQWPPRGRASLREAPRIPDPPRARRSGMFDQRPTSRRGSAR